MPDADDVMIPGRHFKELPPYAGSRSQEPGNHSKTQVPSMRVRTHRFGSWTLDAGVVHLPDLQYPLGRRRVRIAARRESVQIQQLPRFPKNVIEHWFGQLACLCVLLAGMIGRNHVNSVFEYADAAMTEIGQA